MTKHEQHDQLDRLVHRSFEESIPANTRQALQQELDTVRRAWQTKAERSHPLLPVYGTHPRMTWLAAAACLLLVALGSTYLVLNRHPTRKTRPTPSYACATAYYPVSYARCTAVFYSKENPKMWIERRMVVIDEQGNVTKVTAYNQERS